jgi:hypothetical protein
MAAFLLGSLRVKFFALSEDFSARHPELVSGSIHAPQPTACRARWTLKQVQGDVWF